MVKIEFLEWTKKTPLEYDVETVKEAVEKAVEDGANLDGANLYGATLSRANLYGKQLWHVRPFLTLGLCGRSDRMTNVFFFEDGSEPVVNCGCFCGNIKEFAAKIHETHAGTFHEVEYMAMVEHIKAIRQYQTEHPEKNETETSEQSE